MKIYGQFDFINISVCIYDTSPQLYIYIYILQAIYHILDNTMHMMI